MQLCGIKHTAPYISKVHTKNLTKQNLTETSDDLGAGH